MNSPWGKIQTKNVHQRGVTWVSTSSHGGFMVSKGFAEKFLSEAARKRALRYGNYYCFEEDCDCCMVFNELIYVQTEETRTSNFRNLSRYHPDYLLEVGIEPEASLYAEWLRDIEEGKRRATKDPDLVVAGVNLDESSGQVKAWTADGKEHTVTKESYHKVMFDTRTRNLSDMSVLT